MASTEEVTSPVATQVLDGKSIAADVRKQVAAEIARIKGTHPNFRPKLVIIQVNEEGFSILPPFSFPCSSPRLVIEVIPMFTYE